MFVIPRPPALCVGILCWLTPCSFSLSQFVRISEFLADNVTIAPDNIDFDDYSDWIELENTTDQAINLAGHFLSDDPADPLKWRIPEDASIPAGGFWVVRADGFDAGPGETHVRAFSPWDDFQTNRFHANFRLSATGESVVLSRLDAPIREVTYVTLESPWRFFDEGRLPSPSWFHPDYDDAEWKRGRAELGYGEDDENTKVSYGPDDQRKFPTTYFRKVFQVADPPAIVELNCRALIDDGAVIYLNGTEIARPRMSSETITYGSFAARTATEDRFDPITIPKGLLRRGENTIAVEVHQRSETSSDISFSLELTGTETTGTPVILDAITFDAQAIDVSFGRNPAAEGSWTYFGEPTPGRSNDTPPTLDRIAGGTLDLTPKGGFFDGPQEVALQASSPGAVIRYTLDGTTPTSSSTIYDAPLHLTQTAVVRARTFQSGKIPGPVTTETYFISEPERPLSVVSFTVDPETFFDPEIGLYDNVHKGREAPSTVEWFESDRSLGFKVNAGCRIGGENIWRFAQKPLNIALRGKYGDDFINYQVFPEIGLGLFDRLGFRNGGDNWNDAMLRDAMAPSLVSGQMNNDVSFYRPVVLYLNGQYWGIHNVRSRYGDRYFASRYQISAGEYDFLERRRTVNGVDLVADQGSADAYLQFESFVKNTDLTDETNYQQAIAHMDLDSFMDYVALVDFVYESSWRHNQEFWRPRRPDGKWRWNINDIDRGFNPSNVTRSLIDNMSADHPVFDALRKNSSFVHRFSQRYAAHLGSTFHPDRVAAIIDTLAEEVDPEIERHITRWKGEGGIQSLADRRREIDQIKAFAQGRSTHVFSDMAGHLGIAHRTAELTIALSEPAAGTVLVNGVPVLPQFSNTLKLYQGIPFDLTAKPNPGYSFAGWSHGRREATVSIVLNGNRTLIAHFERSSETVLPSTITSDLQLTREHSPYTASGDVLVAPDITLTIDPGVSLIMPPASSILVRGALNIAGTTDQPVTVEPRRGESSWGGIGFLNATGTSTLRHFVLKQATSVATDPVNLKAALSALNSDLVIEHADIAAPEPIFARGGSTILRHSLIRPLFTGDGINVKSGQAVVEDCTFFGNLSPDTDAIDMDQVVNGVVRGCRIYAFRGGNSDAIDLGEACINLVVTENRIYNCSDKGVSVGQGSSVTISRNLIVDCGQGVGVKDSGSVATIDQNTFARNKTGVAVFEKNLGRGGGRAIVTNCLFSRSKNANVSVDTLSRLEVSYSLADTLTLPPGSGNELSDPLFVNPALYDFSLQEGSPALDSGDPAHALDPDGSRADRGARYRYDPEDYPFQVPNTVVINEVMAHSSALNGDWIELYNRGGDPIEIGGWYLSDSSKELRKYRIEDGTIIGGGEHLVFRESDHFGESSTDPGKLIPFALSENGETVSLFGPSDGLFLDYLEKESFGPSASNVSKGLHFKESTNTFNFVAMKEATPGAPNSSPLVGPLVISEIMYNPLSGGAEYLELLNIGSDAVTLYDLVKGAAWQITDGVSYTFPNNPPLTVAPGKRVVLVKNRATFRRAHEIPPDVPVLQWTDGALSNGGERIELSSPGDLDSKGIRQYIREDRVNYEDHAPWPTEPDLGLHSLTRLNPLAYGNDPSNWTAAPPSPGQSSYQQWASEHGLTSEQQGTNEDPDQDGRSNFYEFGMGTNPLVSNPRRAVPEFRQIGADIELNFPLSRVRPELVYRIESSPDLSPGSWTVMRTLAHPNQGEGQFFQVVVSPREKNMFYRFVLEGFDFP